MFDRQQLEALLMRGFPKAPLAEVAAAANAIMALPDEWHEVDITEAARGAHDAIRCGDLCYLARAAANDTEFRVFFHEPPRW
jgi:hypothetical protein